VKEFDMSDRTCTVAGCEGRIKGRGLCNRHIIRERRYGDPLAYFPNAAKACSVDGCEGRHHARGWCVKHWNRWRLNGDPELLVGTSHPGLKVSDSPTWVGDEVTYAGMHGRLRRYLGLAKDRVCVCGRRARDWAYDHQDVDEKQSERGPFSTKFEHYTALCHSCHIALDRAPARGHRASDLYAASS
jgi:hypothetical protein